MHLARGIAIVRFTFPQADRTQRSEFKQGWSRQLVDLLGVHMEDMQIDLPAAAMIVSNHISWLDIFVINALAQTHFVCKDEVRDWPVIGWLVARTDTVFIARGNRAAAARTAQTLAGQLNAGARITVFPEGTTSNGQTLLPFHAALLQAATSSGSVVVPMALRYLDKLGAPSLAPAYDGDITMWQCMRAILLADRIKVEVKVLAAISSDSGRRQIANTAYRQIATSLGMSPALPTRVDTKNSAA